MTQQDVIETGKRVIIVIGRSIIVIVKIDTLTKAVVQLKFDSEYSRALLDISSSNVKVFNLIRETHMKQVFTGTVENIKYAPTGEIASLSGYTNCIIDGSSVAFNICKDINSIGEHKISELSNYYIDVEPGKKTSQLKSNLFLSSIVIAHT